MRRLLISSLLSLLSQGFAASGFDVSYLGTGKAHLTKPGQAVEIKVTNPHNFTDYGVVEIYKLLKSPIEPTTEGETREVLLEDVTQEGLAISPEQIVLQPHQSRVIQIMEIEDPKKETYYYYTVRSLSEPIKNAMDEKDSEGKTTFMIDIKTVLRRFMLRTPLLARPQMEAHLEKGDLIITNQGDASCVNAKIKVCKDGDCENHFESLFLPQKTFLVEEKDPDSISVTCTKENEDPTRFNLNWDI